MKFLKFLAWLIGIVIVIAILLVMFAPTKVHIEKSIAIHAPDSVIWPHIVKFEHFNKWSEWSKMDPGATFSIQGEDGTEGASTTWKGKKIGDGKLQHTHLQPYSKVQQKIYFYQPEESQADVQFDLVPNERSTVVTWTFDSEMKRPYNVMGLLMKGMLSDQFEDGLESLKEEVEGTH
ncbi:hypothetical protein COR50_05490 [Chitinophaga caeni]|uniref:Polyketide cyclase n=1 Tax=Chitinophaga caeni TaxID=2029983 RepID=A0A291QRP4_9BACT|nr:SRPBCC family protein [Chitinophaga caeni]ATL46679.1 hypothetical protein COR50_05490 [Chitinophaga caeni]